jgi:hypothetical protein
MSEILTTKKINHLLGERFYIPSYQRGYRWTHYQVKDLLDDIWEFEVELSGDNKVESFYCLQPIVVKKRLDPQVIEVNNEEKPQWEVIDGQQRLTTIFIILHHINRVEYSSRPKNIFEIDYQTRDNCIDFFKDIENVEKANTNIDFYHIHKAYSTIDKWFITKEKENDSIRHDFRSKLLNQARVIWYDAQINPNKDENITSIDIFTRLNIGKIPLTNAELIKALFLQKSNFSEENASLMQLQIASEWDSIEKALQSKAFWLFIYNPNNPLKYENRIEFIFDLMKKRSKDKDELYTFIKFNEDFKNSKKSNNGKANIEELWLKIKKYFLSFEEWYDDKELYHLIGYLIEFGADINILKDKSLSKTKLEFKEYLKSEIKKKVNCQVNELTYKGNLIKEVLLLFNIQIILATKNADMRFPFYRYKDENWDIEHIRSQTDLNISKPKREAWAIDVLEYFTGLRNYKTEEEIAQQTGQIKRLDTDAIKGKLSQKDLANLIFNFLLKTETTENDFEDIYSNVTLFFKEDKEFENKDGIGNLALLDSKTNRSYGNAMFPIKRQRIINNDMNGVFVPIATKNVFLKSYSKKLGDVMHWSENDAKDYQSAIINTLKEYLPNQDI